MTYNPDDFGIIAPIAVLTDGTRAMTADLDIGTHKILNVVDPLTNQQAATKKYVDDNVVAGAVPSGRLVNTTSPLAGGGDLSADRTLTTTMATNRLVGRGTAGTGVMEEILIGTNLTLAGTTLNATGGGGGGMSQAQSLVLVALRG